MRYLLFIAFFINIECLISQCPGNSYIFNSQIKIDDFPVNFPSCIDYPFGLTIEESSLGNISNLNGLTQLQSVSGNLTIFSNGSLNDITGLSNIHTVSGFLDVESNGALSNFLGLGSLSSVYDYLTNSLGASTINTNA